MSSPPNFDDASIKAQRLMDECREARADYLFAESPHWRDTQEAATLLLCTAWQHMEKDDVETFSQLLVNALQMTYLRGYQRRRLEEERPTLIMREE